MNVTQTASWTSPSGIASGLVRRAPIGQAVRQPKSAEIIATSIRRGVVTGELKEGDYLPSEAELMEQFAVSRPTLREAFRILEAESLISIRRGSRGGARIVAPDIAVATRFVGLLLQMKGTTIGEVFESRAAIEVEAARMLAVRRTPEVMATLQQIHSAMLESVPDARDNVQGALANWSELAWQFHAAIVEGAGNRALELQWSLFQDIIKTHTQVAVTKSAGHPRNPDTLRKTLKSYERFMTFVRDKDAAGASEQWRAHMEVSTKILSGGQETTAIVDLFS